MVKVICFLILFVAEIFTTTCMGVLWDTTKSPIFIVFIVLGIVLSLITTIVYIRLEHNEKQQEKLKQYAKCPYFIEKD